MPARITIQSGIAAGTSHRIEGRVARVGSDPQADVCLPTADIPEHALTLEFRENACLIYNRSRESVYVGARVIEPDHVVEWPETDILQLGEATELLLDFDDAEFDGRQFDSELEAEEPAPALADPETPAINGQESQDNGNRNSKTVIQLVVTFLCLAGCAVLLIRDQNRKSLPDSGPGFAEIIANAIENQDVSPVLIKRLQHAEAERVRGRLEVAHDEYRSIRDDLVASVNAAGDAPDPPTSQILIFVESRLARDR